MQLGTELEISEQEFDRWFTPDQALRLISKRMEWTTAKSTIVRYISRELLLARADTIIVDDVEERKTYRRAPVPHEQCDHNLLSPQNRFWQNGLLDWSDYGENGKRELSAFDVRFDPATIRRIASPARGTEPPEEATAVESPRAKGGAPRKGWWDDLWIEMIRRIRANELHPESGAELQRIMLDWLAEQEIYPGEETLKKMALKLFKYLQE